MINLLQETKRAIKKSGHTVSEISFIGSLESGYSCSWIAFARMADRDYECNFGERKVAQDLVIVFADRSRLERDGFDGEEWWKYIALTKIPYLQRSIKALFVDDVGGVGWMSLKEINEGIKPSPRREDE